MKLRAILEITPCLRVLATKELPGRTALRISEFLHVLAPKAQSADAARLNVCKQFGKQIPGDRPGSVQFVFETPEQDAACAAEMNTLLDTDMDVKPDVFTYVEIRLDEIKIAADVLTPLKEHGVLVP